MVDAGAPSVIHLYPNHRLYLKKGSFQLKAIHQWVVDTRHRSVYGRLVIYLVVNCSGKGVSAISLRISSTRHAVTPGLIFTDLGKRPDLTPFHHVVSPTG